jgi:hypothetical protein
MEEVGKINKPLDTSKDNCRQRRNYDGITETVPLSLMVPFGLLGITHVVDPWRILPEPGGVVQGTCTPHLPRTCTESALNVAIVTESQQHSLFNSQGPHTPENCAASGYSFELANRMIFIPHILSFYDCVPSDSHDTTEQNRERCL